MRMIIVALSLLAVPALAEGKLKEACGADSAKLCPNVGPGKGLHHCLKEHAAELSAPCADAVASMKHGHRPPPTPAPAQ